MKNTPYIEYPTLIDSVVATADYTSDAHDCRGMACAKGVGIPVGLTDAGGIDQTIDLQGSVDSTLWTDIANPFVTFTGAAVSIESSLVDVRGYSLVRAKYNKEGASAGAISLWLNLLAVNDA